MVTSGYGPRTAWHGCTLMVWSNDSQDATGAPYDARTGTVRAPQGNLQCFSYPTGPVRGPCGTRKGAVRHPCGHVRELIQLKLTKIPHGCRIWPYGARTGPLRSPHGLFKSCLWSQNPYRARKLIMHALKLYGPRTGRQNSYGAARGPCGPREWTYEFCSKQPGNSPGTARTGPGSVMWLRHYLHYLVHLASQRTHGASITSLLFQNDVVASFWRNSEFAGMLHCRELDRALSNMCLRCFTHVQCAAWYHLWQVEESLCSHATKI